MKKINSLRSIYLTSDTYTAIFKRKKAKFSTMVFFTLLCFFSMPNDLQADITFADTEENFKITYDECAGSVKVRVRVYDFDSFEDDFMRWFKASVDGELIFWYKDTGFTSGSPIATKEIEGRTFYYYHPSSTVSFEKSGDNHWVNFTYSDLPDNDLGGTSTISIEGWWDGRGTGDYDVHFTSWTRTTPTQPTIGTPSQLTASSEEFCDYVKLTWVNNNSDIDNCADSKQFTIIERKEKSSNTWEYLTTKTFPATTHENHSAEIGKEYDYRAQHVFSPNSNRSDHSSYTNSSISGSRKTVPPVPPSFTASQENCDGSIDLAWEWDITEPNPDYFEVYNSNNVETITIPGGGIQRSYKEEGLDRGVNYNYYIRAINNCGPGDWSSISPGISPAAPAQPTNFSATADPTTGVTFTWSAAANATGYKIERINKDLGGGTTFFTVDGGNMTTYLDNSLNACQDYEYQLLAVNICEEVESAADPLQIKITPDIINTFSPTTSLEASKGFYSERVELRWTLTNPSNFITGYKISKKRLGSTEGPTVKSFEANETEWTDEHTDAGVLYEYSIQAEAKCGNNQFELSNIATTIGFRSPFGIVTGNVSYAGGTAVEGVRVTAESTEGVFGRSLDFDGGVLPIGAGSLDIADEILLEAWIKPKSYDFDFTIFQKEENYSLRYKSATDKYHFIVSESLTEHFEVTMPASEIPLNNFSHIAAQVINGHLELYVNGISKTSVATTLTSIWDNTFTLNIGLDYEGILDEVRIWKKGKTADDIQRDYSRLMTGSESGLKVYLRMDEGVGSYAYDISKSGSVQNSNHAQHLGDIAWTDDEDDIPTASQLGVAGYTDDLGNYVLNIPYHIGGEVFVLQPSYLVHTFSPSTQTRFLGDGASIHGAVDFTDESSFIISGDVVFEGTTCGVPDAFVKVDGKLVVDTDTGQPITTDGVGHFEVPVPIGEHFITIEQEGHEYSVGRFPPTGKHDFQESFPIPDPFVDKTKVTVMGRIVGGLREANKPMYEESVNNIGVTKIELDYPLAGPSACFSEEYFTDDQGKYSFEVPPLNFKAKVTVLSDISTATPYLQDNITEETFDFSGVKPDLTTETNPNGDDSSYHHKVDLIYQVKSKIEVVTSDGVSPFIGDETYTYIDENDVSHVLDLRADPKPFKWPVFHQGDDKHQYRSRILVFEEYINKDDPNDIKRDRVPTTDGILTIDNELAQGTLVDDVYEFGQVHEIKLDEIFSEDELKYLDYTWKPGFPSFSTNANPDYNYTHKFSIDYLSSTGVQSSWKPMPNDEFFRGYLLGNRSNGVQIITKGPPLPQYVLRDPPGSGSSATREKGTTESKTHNWSWNLGGEAYTTDDLYVGSIFSVGVGVQTTNTVQTNINAGFSVNRSGGNSGTESITITNTEEWSTSDGTDIAPGASSDVYIAKSQNISVGIAETLTIIPNSLIGVVPSVDANTPNLANEVGNGFTFGKTSGYSVVEGGYETTVIVTEYDIKNIIIPRIIEFRNTYLEFNTGTKYSDVLPTSDPNYGKNNDDPVFGMSASTTTPNTGEYEDWDGPSYKYYGDEAAVNAALAANDETTLELLLTEDSVRVFNTWINKWEEAIRQNEWEKVNINNKTVINEKKQEELDALEEQNDAVLDWWDEIGILLTALELKTYALIVAPVPGTAVKQAELFGITTASNIEIAERSAEYEAYLQQKERIEEKYEEILKEPATNYTFGGNTSYTKSMTHSSATSNTKSVEFGLGAELLVASKKEIGGNGFGVEKGLQLDFTTGRDWSTETEPTETVSYTLSANTGDLISVDVYPSILGWGPIFKTKAGSATSCPHEEAIVTEFYEPGTVISPTTLQVEKPGIKEEAMQLYNIPSDEVAVFQVTLKNESEIDYTQAYDLRLLSSSNEGGAIVRIDGVASQSIELPTNTDLVKTVTVQKGPGPTYEYDDLLVVFTSQCQYTAGTGFNTDIADTVKLTAHFTPACTDVSLVAPVDQWVLNNNADEANTMVVAIADYNYNMEELESLVLEYKPSQVSQFSPAKTFLKDNSGSPTLAEIPDDAASIQFDWDVSELGLPDGEYDLRVRSNCTLAEENSIVHSGIIDRRNPKVFGTPTPGDGILSPNDDISIRFTEPISYPAGNPSFYFDVRGVTNGTQGDHSTTLLFDGVDDYVEITGGVALQRRDFTIEFSVKRNRSGVEEAIISQGTDVNERLFIGFDASDHFVFRLNEQEVASTTTYVDNDWHFFAVSYDYENETAELFEVNGTSTTNNPINNGNTTLYPKYIGSGKLAIGKNTVNTGGTGDFFSGNFHELRIWNKALTFSEFDLNKNSLLSGIEYGLLYNWRMDEATGNLVEEHIRRRDGTIVGPTWQVTPNGYSAPFDGVDDYLKITTGDVNITPGMDFTLEFWFNSSQTSAATLFSNGTGSDQEADALRSWIIEKDALGKIHIKHNGIDTVMVEDDYFDGTWHHFALVFQRSGNMSSYIDGNFQKGVQALHFEQLGGASMYLGAWGRAIAQNESITNYFMGKMDEFRFWKTARKLAQVKRDKQHRMNGDEPALELYLPFEYYASVLGVPTLTGTFDEQINPAMHTVEVEGIFAPSDQTPTIKLQRPVQAITYDWSLNNDQIIITPTAAPEVIENVTLDIIVQKLKDLQGNAMESPVSWIAYMDKNQVVWQEDLLQFSKMKGDDLSFTSGIINKGGEAKAFEILDLPDWLTASPQSGTLDPNSGMTIHFQVDSEIGIGEYINDISLLTDFNFPERLTIEMNVEGEAPDWTVNPGEFVHSMGIIGQLKINNVVSTDEKDLLAAVVGMEVRGVANLEYVSSLDAYLVFMDVYSDEIDSEELTFRIWDASTGTIYTDVAPINLTFTADVIIGTVPSPKLFTTGNEISFDVPLHSGWNWLGFPLLPDDPRDITSILESFEHTEGDQIKGLTKYENFINDEWEGTLDNFGVGIQPEQLYKLNTALPGILTMKGTVIDPTTRPIELVDNWNWIGFISIRNMPIAQALGNLNPYPGDIIKGKSQFAVYDAPLGWIGSLKTLKPGQGFMYQSNGPNTFTFPIAGMFNNLTEDPSEEALNLAGVDPDSPIGQAWQEKAAKFSVNMTLLGAVRNNCGEDLATGQYAIAAYDKEGTARAFAPIERLAEQEVFYLTILGASNDQLSLRLLNTETGTEMLLDNPLTFDANRHQGDYDHPFEIEISDKTCLLLNPEAPTLTSGLAAFPTVFKHSFSLLYDAKELDENAHISISNVWGQVVFTSEAVLEKGANRVEVDLSGKDLTAGLYTVELRTNGLNESLKLIRSN